MSHAQTIARESNSANDAAAAIRRTLEEETPDLTPGSGPWNAQARIMAYAVGAIMRQRGKTGSSATFGDRVCDILGCGRQG